MRWVAKAVVQKALSQTPWAEPLNFQLSKRVLRSYPESDDAIRVDVDSASRHLATARTVNGLEPHELTTFEFGAGWSLSSPLAAWMLGVDRQILVDLADHLRLELVEHARGRLLAMHGEFEAAAGRALRAPERPIRQRSDLAAYGLDFRAPADARATDLADGSVDLVVSTFTLEHIPWRDIEAILGESARILRPGALVSSLIDCQDHYAFVDPSISVYNFMRFSGHTWSLINSDLHFQNRLRSVEHVELHRRAGLEVVSVADMDPDPEQVRGFEALDLQPRFQRFSRQELLVPGTHVVAAAPAA